MKWRERLAEIRHRAILDFSTDTTGSDESKRRGCRLCDWHWHANRREAHEPSCPLNGTEQRDE